jgi:hypothetical protein
VAAFVSCRPSRTMVRDLSFVNARRQESMAYLTVKTSKESLQSKNLFVILIYLTVQDRCQLDIIMHKRHHTTIIQSHTGVSKKSLPQPMEFKTMRAEMFVAAGPPLSVTQRAGCRGRDKLSDRSSVFNTAKQLPMHAAYI